MITLSQIRTRLIQSIKESGMSQTEIASKLNLTVSAISHILKGDIMPTLDTLANLCRVLDLDANYILCLENDGLCK